MSISTAVDASAVARVLGIKTEFIDLRGGNILSLPQRIAIVGQGSTLSVYDADKRQIFSALEAAQVYGFGSPIHLAALKLLPVNGDGVGSLPVTVYPLVDDAGGAASVGDITPAGAATVAAAYRVRINNIDSVEFIIPVGAVVADMVTLITDAINATPEMPVTAVDSATVVDLTSKWEGTSANDIYVEIVGSTTAGSTFAFTQPVGGLVNPDISTAIAQMGGVWETMVLNCLDIADTVTLDLYATLGESRWGSLVRKPLVVFTGNTALTVALATAVSDVRTLDRTNSQLVAPGSNDLPFAVAARQLARIAVVANTNPAHDYGSQQATGLTPGDDGDQWTYPDKDLAVKTGSSTIDVQDGVVKVSDVVTFYHPAGDTSPAYRFVVDIVRLQNIIFNLDLIFATPEWDGAPLIPDDQATVNRSAKKPKTAVAAVAALLDGLGLEAIISDPDTAKASIVAGINANNPKRLDLAVTVQLSGNTNIKSVDLDFGFFFGTAQVVA